MDRFNNIFSKQFATSKTAIAYCQNLARLCGFGVRIRTSKTTTIYIVCSREGLPDVNRELKKRGRNSERCNCDWRIVLRQTHERWEFRTGKSMEHNHVVFSSTEYLDADLTPQPKLPSLRSLDLPTPRLSGSSSPIPSYSTSPSNVYRLPPLTRVLPSTMQRPSPYSRPASISFLLN